MNSSKNARFWVPWRHGLVKLTLKPGQSLHASHGGPDDEGWSWTLKGWEHQGNKVVYQRREDGCDCDGRIRDYQKLECPIQDLHAHEFEGRHYPKWQDAEHTRRDFQAEAAGY